MNIRDLNRKKKKVTCLRCDRIFNGSRCRRICGYCNDLERLSAKHIRKWGRPAKDD